MQTGPDAAPILIVDDRPENLLSLEAVLEPLHQPIVRAASGDDALRRVLNEDFAVILLDVNMPGMDGYETARMIKQRPRCRHVPIIFLTAAERASAVDFYKLGAVDFLQKPFLPEVLVAKVSVFVELFLRGERLRLQELELLRRAAKQAELERARFAELFLGVVSHDLRTPLTAMLSMMQLLGKRLTDDESKRFVQRALASGERMSRMIDQLLDLTRVRLGGGMTLKRANTDLAELVARVVEEQRAAHIGRRFDVRATGDVRGNWDSDRIEQIVQNLVGNAVAHGAKTDPVTITLSGDATHVRLDVHNAGRPVPFELRTSLFDPFRRGTENAPSPSGGLGLGLYIVQQVASAHGGHVKLESDERGTTFRVELPRNGEPL